MATTGLFFVVFILISCFFPCLAKEFTLYAYKFAKPAVHQISTRSGASQEYSVALKTNDVLKLVFCLPDRSDVRITGISMSNDGSGDDIAVLLDWNLVGTVKSPDNNLQGKGWNIFAKSESVGLKRTLDAGRHIIALNVTNADKHGVEIDSVALFIGDYDISNDAFNCRVFCFNHITYDNIEGRDYIASARLEQRSTKTNCAEEDNIKIPFYHDRITKFSITASHPKYKAFINSRNPDFENCKMADRLLWQFEDLIYPFPSKQVNNGKAIITHDKNDDHNIIVTFFSLSGPRNGIIDSEIGSNLFLKLKNVSSPIEIGLAYYGRQKKLIPLEFVTFSPEKQNYTWNISDFSWNESPENILRILLPLNLTQEVHVDLISLNKRETKHDTTFKVFDNSEKIIEGVDVDFFWRSAGKMIVTVKETGETYSTADYIRVYTHLPWGSHSQFSQVFVLYRDGHVRILPITPPGVDWIPFGSSIVIGESNPEHDRPLAFINEVEIDMQKNEFKLKYADGNSATIELQMGFAKTLIIVKDVKFKNKNRLPFMIYRSMYVSDGNNDVDHVRVNNNPPRRIISDWRYLFGTSIAFYRKCLSRHNTLSPDIQMELLEENWG